jgi:hypothetical protein
MGPDPHQVLVKWVMPTGVEDMNACAKIPRVIPGALRLSLSNGVPGVSTLRCGAGSRTTRG